MSRVYLEERVAIFLNIENEDFMIDLTEEDKSLLCPLN